MAAPNPSPGGRRRAELGQHFLTDARFVDVLVGDLGIEVGELVVDLGAGGGALTSALLRVGARVIAVEADPRWADHLRRSNPDSTECGLLRVVRSDMFDFRFPRESFRVVSNPPFGESTSLLRLLLERPELLVSRVDVVLQREVARKRAARPPTSLLSAAWAPWWEVELGRSIPRRAFDPVPRVDAALVHFWRRVDPVLPSWLAREFVEVLRWRWERGP